MNTHIPLEIDTLDEKGRPTSLGCLNQHLASGKYGDHKFDIGYIMPGPGIMITMNGRTVTTKMDGVLEKILNEMLGIMEREKL